MEQELRTAQAATASIKDDALATAMALAAEVGGAHSAAAGDTVAHEIDAAHSAGYTVAFVVALLALVI